MAMAFTFFIILVIFSALILFQSMQLLRKPNPAQKMSSTDEESGTQWAVLVAGSSGYANYRHQADVCHSYQILKKGGMKDENIIIFMYDDVAYDQYNPRPGIIINHPNGSDVYAGVPKNAVRGGSGKVVDSKSNDRIFIYIASHGHPGVLGMPKKSYISYIEFISLLQKKYESNSYKSMLIYVEACKSGSIFVALPEELNIYVNTAANSTESSYGVYCPWEKNSPSSEYLICIGDRFSVFWMENSERKNLKFETIENQYQIAKKRTSVTYKYGSHVMEFGTKSIKAEELYLYLGYDPSNAVSDNSLWQTTAMPMAIKQSDAELFFMWKLHEHLDDSSKDKAEVLKKIKEKIKHRSYVDNNIDIIGKLIFGYFEGPSILQSVRPYGQPLVDDLDCLKSMIHIFETHCVTLIFDDMKHSLAFANVCNKGVSMEKVKIACISACADYHSEIRSTLIVDDLLYMWRLYEHLDDSSKDKAEVLKKIKKTIKHRSHVDNSIDTIGKLIFGYFEGPSILQSVRPYGQPLVDDLDCLKSMINTFKTYCGSITFYDMKHSQTFANICNKGVSIEKVKIACISACADLSF